MQIRNKSMRRRLVIAAISLLLSSGVLRAQDGSFGGRLYHEKADCQFCHGINGDGRGDPRSPGRAADLRDTKLDREQLIEVIRCGRLGSKNDALLRIQLLNSGVV